MSYLRDYHAQRRHLTRLCRALGLPLSEQGPKRKVPLHNNLLRAHIHDHCYGPDWGECTGGMNAADMDRSLAHMVDTLEMRNGYALAVAQACIRAGKHETRMARADMAVVRDAKGRTVVRPMTHAHRMARYKAASEYYALAREYQAKHEAERAG